MFVEIVQTSFISVSNATVAISPTMPKKVRKIRRESNRGNFDSTKPYLVDHEICICIRSHYFSLFVTIIPHPVSSLNSYR